MGGSSPATSISRTFVPLRNTWSSRRMRARLRARHRAARLAPERVLEEHRLDVELVRLELVEDQLRVVRAVVVADARVVAADDEVRAAVVLAADRVPDRLARARVAHRGRERGDEHAVGRVVAVDEHAVALDARRGRHVVRLRVADERVDQQPVDGLERDLRQVLVRSVDRVARLEADDALPAALGERGRASRRGRARARGTRARAARTPSPCRRGTSASARRAARRRDARRRSSGSTAPPRAPCRSRRRSSTSSVAEQASRPRRRARRRRRCGASSTARQTGSAQGSPPARCMSSTTER